MMLRVYSTLFLLSLLAGRVEAQDLNPAVKGLSPAVKYGKWVLLAGSLGMNYLAVLAHNRAEDTFDILEASCSVDNQRCALGPDRTYADPEIEALYQTSLQYDSEARLWLIGGETALAGATVLFVWELTRPKGRPDNIPFEPEVRSLRAGGTGLGLRLAF
ncbi:MAG TPA: hypothetical protein VNO19_10360 [Gemmatimonadales bacterium]|nr:hypothetical protein [Gemmatimonadales bacterium]